MKICRKCGEDDQGAFYASQNTICKPCNNAAGKIWKLANAESHAAYLKKWRNDNLERDTANKKKYRKDFPAKNAAQTAKRKASKLQRTPLWADTAEEALAVEKLHRLAQAFT